MNPLVLQQILMYMLAFIIAVTLHEFSHAFVADRLGDDTPRVQGRVTLNPLDHLDVMGMLVLIMTAFAGYAFGWGRPVLVMKSKFKNPRMGDALVSVAGPLSNLLLATLAAVTVRTGYFGLPNSSPWHEFVDVCLNLNILLFVFNLIPIPPLDGSHILADFLPDQLASSYRAAMARFGWVLFFALIYFGGLIIAPELALVHSWLVPTQ